MPGGRWDFRERAIQQHGKNATLTSENRRSRRRRWRSQPLPSPLGEFDWGCSRRRPAARRCGTIVCLQLRREFAVRVRCLQECSGARRGSSTTRDKRARNRYCIHQELRHSHVEVRRKEAVSKFATIFTLEVRLSRKISGTGLSWVSSWLITKTIFMQRIQ